MAIPFVLPSDEEADQEQSQQQLEQLMLDLYTALQQVLRARNAQHPSRNHRLPRRSGDLSGTREHPMVLVDSDLSRLPLPDLVLSAVEQLPPPPPQVTVSAPSSPTRDAAFQFPECSAAAAGAVSVASAMTSAPVPSPRPKPRRRRLTSEGSLPSEKELHPQRFECGGARGTCCVHHLASSLDEREWATVGANLRVIADDFHASKTKHRRRYKRPQKHSYRRTRTRSFGASNDSSNDLKKPKKPEDEIEKSRLSFISSTFASSTGRSLLSSDSGGNNTASSSPSGSTDSLLSLLIPQPLRETLWTTLALYLGWRLVSRLR